MKNKVVVVIGATSMIGQAVARLFSECGATLVLIGRSAEKMEKLFGKLNTSHFVADVTDTPALTKVINEIAEQFGQVDCLIQNTAIYPFKFAESLSLDEWDQTLKTNLTACFVAAKAVIPIMKMKKSGKIIFISSVAGEIFGLPGMSSYTATKAGLNGFMRSLSIELARFNINVNCISPGKVYDVSTLNAEEQEKLLKPVPLKRFIKPVDIAHMSLFLASSHAVNITGQNFVIDGGQTILAEEAHTE